MADSQGHSVEALKRGLRCLQAANLRNGVSVADCARDVGLPRMTAFRLLETLREADFLTRGADNAYRPAFLVQSLSNGFDESQWIDEVAFPEILALAADVVWPVGVATPAGLDMRVRIRSDPSNPLALERFNAGRTLPMESSAAGQVYLGSLPEAECKRLLDSIESARELPQRREIFEEHLRETARSGHAEWPTPGKRERIIAVPITLGGRVVACCGMQYIATGVQRSEISERFLPALQQATTRISNRLALMGEDSGVRRDMG